MNNENEFVGIGIQELDYYDSKLIVKTSSFFNDNTSYGNSDIVILGIPMDYTASNIPGSRFAPKRVRELSLTLENYSPILNGTIDSKFHDAGDLVLPWGNFNKSLELIENISNKFIIDGKKIISIGGDHLITLPLVSQYVKKYPDITVIHIDAHTDLRDEWSNETYSHATVIKRVYELIEEGNLYQFGIRSGSFEEFEFAKEHTHLFKNDVLEPLKKVIGSLKNKPIYLTIDIDILDPAFAPGTGYLEAGGISSRELLDSVYLIISQLDVVGVDLVEVCPPTDISDRTSAIAAKLLREIIIGMGK
ncbi:MAG: agmatinase [Candidatus Acididesulfobacter diazotrophicus]|jgi:agmatinase|uniref:Agmatinase n=1 Tax=Candidatus Acididesulfobacter diazotrophicus TaxID=2597226 RepID=A0A519BP54_9DELT|nr:MAG: agmatinase [Candidatus Acididesulfobacter diazotrophicus]